MHRPGVEVGVAAVLVVAGGDGTHHEKKQQGGGGTGEHELHPTFLPVMVPAFRVLGVVQVRHGDEAPPPPSLCLERERRSDRDRDKNSWVFSSPSEEGGL